MKELLEARERDLKEKTAQANELATFLDSCSKKNRELLAQAAKVDFAPIKVAEEHA